MTGRRSHPTEPAAQAAPPEAARFVGHVPVLLEAVLAALAPRDDAVYVDGTFGGGGYSEALLNAAHCQVFGIDRDPAAVQRGRGLAARYGHRLRILEGRFGDMPQLLAPVNTGPIAGIALDLGVSSTQLDTPERGFSFRSDGPLDMRMSGAGQSAADLVATLSESDLAELIRALGEERFARRIARAISAARQRRPIQRTTELADIVHSVVPQSEPGQDPATRTFQALRIAVNDELGELDRGLAAAEQLLAPGGRLAVVSFHSLEDRRVKEFLRRRSDMAPRASRHRPVGAESPPPSFTLLTRRAVKPSAAEIAHNPRARAARLRTAARTVASPWPRKGERHLGGRHRAERA
ncbi:MAG: 16S rRNA (cytosine(1402)-N(4))-methyltransferase RsmH [Alphaproteobacteria bacterium]|nr:16S rRNA (cytosine(1402)-N(4))-methyltransferase RsmH [Alphaproteobacteria bacterium]